MFLENLPADAQRPSEPPAEGAEPTAAPTPTEPTAAPPAPAPAPTWKPSWADWATTWAFVAAVGMLLAVARNGVSSTTLLIVVGIYVVVTAAWIFRQYVNAAQGRTVLPRASWVALMIVGGLVVAVLAGGLLMFVGALVVYLGLGYAFARTRRRVAILPEAATGPSTPVPADDRSGFLGRVRRMGAAYVLPALDRVISLRGVCLSLATILALLVVGLTTLGEIPMMLSLVILALALVPLPLMISVLAEHGIRYFLTQPSRRFWAVVAGLAVMACGFAGATATGANTLVYVLLAVAAVFVVALASSTLVDIAAVLALIAWMGVTADQAAPLTPPTAESTSVIVAIGDSYISGEGAKTFIEGTDEGGGNQCRRARTAWPVRLVDELDAFDGLVFLACSGADTFNVRLTQPPNGAPQAPTPTPQFEGERTQLDEWSSEWSDVVQDPALVVVSLGGNDAGFSKIGLACLAPGDCSEPSLQHVWLTGNLERVRNRLRQAYSDIDATFGDSPVVVVPYPDPVAETAPCPEANLSPGDIAFINQLLTTLDAVIEQVASEFGFFFVAEAKRALAAKDLQLCDPKNEGKPGINFIRPQSTKGLAEHRFNPSQWYHNSLHPNAAGHEAIAEAVTSWLVAHQEVVDPAAPVRKERVNPVAPVSERYDRVVGECWTFGDEDDQDCTDQSNKWVVDQVGKFALARGGIVLAVGAGSWLMIVPLLAWHRGRRRHAST